MKHEKGLTSLTKAVDMFKALVQNLNLEMVKAIMKKVESKEKFRDEASHKPANLKDTCEDKVEEINDIHVNKTQMLFHCDKCEF